MQKILETVNLLERAYFQKFDQKAVNGSAVITFANMQDAYRNRRIAKRNKFLPDGISFSEGRNSRQNDLDFSLWREGKSMKWNLTLCQEWMYRAEVGDRRGRQL